jgi:DNA repair photolyase
VDEDVWRALEPGTAHPMQRLRAVRELVDAGVHAGVLMAPIVPGLSSRPALSSRR